jgi:dienelactone hydrolase
VVREYRIETDSVPARVYEPEGATGQLLLGHNGTLSKDHDRFVMLGRRYAEATGLAVVCIDAPAHGERASDIADPAAGMAAMEAEVVGPADQVVSDWQKTVAALSHIGMPLAYVGFSMGAMKGLSVVASMPTIHAVVLGVAGVPTFAAADRRPPDSVVPHLEIAASFKTDLQVLMLNVTRDDMFRPQDVVELFSAIPGGSKRLMFWEAEHGDLPDEMVQASVDFLRRTSAQSRM